MRCESRTFYVPLLVGLLFLTGCSTSDYSQLIKDFAQATRTSEEALVGLNQEVTEAYREIVRQRALSGELFVKNQGSDCGVGSERCRLVLADRNRNEQPLTPEPALRKILTVMKSVRRYTDSLSAIVTADTEAKVTAQVNATLGNVGNIAETVAKAGGVVGEAEKIKEYATPVGKIVNWIAGQYVAKVKVDGLRRATGEARNVIKRAADLFVGVSDIAGDVPKKALADDVTRRVEAFRRASSDAQALDGLILAAKKYDKFLVANTQSVFSGLKSAHNALADRLQEKGVSLPDVIARIRTYAEEAKKLADALRELRKIHKG